MKYSISSIISVIISSAVFLDLCNSEHVEIRHLDKWISSFKNCFIHVISFAESKWSEEGHVPIIRTNEHYNFRAFPKIYKDTKWLNCLTFFFILPEKSVEPKRNVVLNSFYKSGFFQGTSGPPWWTLTVYNEEIHVPQHYLVFVTRVKRWPNYFHSQGELAVLRYSKLLFLYLNQTVDSDIQVTEWSYLCLYCNYQSFQEHVSSLPETPMRVDLDHFQNSFSKKFTLRVDIGFIPFSGNNLIQRAESVEVFRKSTLFSENELLDLFIALLALKNTIYDNQTIRLNNPEIYVPIQALNFYTHMTALFKVIAFIRF